MQLGAAAAAILATAGGVATFIRPGLERGHLSAGARQVFASVGEAILDGSLPRGTARAPVLRAFLQRVDDLVRHLPQHAQAELSQLLALLLTAPGRIALAGVHEDWPRANVGDVQKGLQAMRTSGSSLRRQAYQALHDIAGAAYFADPATWAQLGYPGPRVL